MMTPEMITLFWAASATIGTMIVVWAALFVRWWW
jgi:hypothetical protein